MLNLLLSRLSFSLLKQFDWCKSSISEYISFKERRVRHVRKVCVCDSEAILIVTGQKRDSYVKNDEQALISHWLPYLLYFLFSKRLWFLEAKFVLVLVLLLFGDYFVLNVNNWLSSVQLFDLWNNLYLIGEVFDLLLLFLLLVFRALATNLAFAVSSLQWIFIRFHNVRYLVNTCDSWAEFLQHTECALVICRQWISCFELIDHFTKFFVDFSLKFVFIEVLNIYLGLLILLNIFNTNYLNVLFWGRRSRLLRVIWFRITQITNLVLEWLIVWRIFYAPLSDTQMNYSHLLQFFVNVLWDRSSSLNLIKRFYFFSTQILDLMRCYFGDAVDWKFILKILLSLTTSPFPFPWFSISIHLLFCCNSGIKLVW